LELDKKIELLEKIMVSNFTEAEVIFVSYEDLEKVLLCPKIAKVSSFEQKGKNY
jgi:hypothetical protein